MNKFRTLTPDQLEDNVFRLISKDWMLITAQRKDGTANTMTASWGSLGVNWGMPVATVYIRHSRYTLPFVDEAEGFSLCVFGEEYRPQLAAYARALAEVTGKPVARQVLWFFRADGAVEL